MFINGKDFVIVKYILYIVLMFLIVFMRDIFVQWLTYFVVD